MKPSLQTSTHARAICLAMETLHPRSYSKHTRCLAGGTYEYSELLQIPQSTISNTVSPMMTLSSNIYYGNYKLEC